MSSGSEASSRAKCAHKTSWLNTSKFYGLIGIRGPLLPGRGCWRAELRSSLSVSGAERNMCLNMPVSPAQKQ